MDTLVNNIIPSAILLIAVTLATGCKQSEVCLNSPRHQTTVLPKEENALYEQEIQPHEKNTSAGDFEKKVGTVVFPNSSELAPRIDTSMRGDYYIKYVPTEQQGNLTLGFTKVFKVEKEQDILIHVYNWVADKTYIVPASDGVTVIRMDNMFAGDAAGNKDITLRFYRKDTLLNEYSTLDLVANPNNVRKYKSGDGSPYYYAIELYPRLNHLLNYPERGEHVSILKLKTVDDREIIFNAETGEIIE